MTFNIFNLPPWSAKNEQNSRLSQKEHVSTQNEHTWYTQVDTSTVNELSEQMHKFSTYVKTQTCAHITHVINEEQVNSYFCKHIFPV